MRWIRSFPARIPEHRAYVVDAMERLIIDDYDYTPLGDIDEDVCLIEWDMALSREGMQLFEFAAELDRSRVLVAPYKLYTIETLPVWAHRRVTAAGPQWIDDGDRTADYFGFGLVYFPRQLVRAFLDAPAPERGMTPAMSPATYNDCRFHDQTFSVWHYWRSNARHREVVPIAWQVQPVHLHY